ncbi:hypothetical protein BDZ91DRAFT_742145 [Kalaharituber pfeilii]|nr:hypothetical protein BDZ91DRAFT_742145 [Kalaharituber pfeilii]
MSHSTWCRLDSLLQVYYNRAESLFFFSHRIPTTCPKPLLADCSYFRTFSKFFLRAMPCTTMPDFVVVVAAVGLVGGALFSSSLPLPPARGGGGAFGGGWCQRGCCQRVG